MEVAGRQRHAGGVEGGGGDPDLDLARTGTANHVAGYVKDAPPDLWQRYLVIIFDGLRPAGAHPLPQPPPVWG